MNESPEDTKHRECAEEIWHLFADDCTIIPAAHAIESILRRHFPPEQSEQGAERLPK